MSKNQAIEAATRFAEEQGMDVQRYAATDARLDDHTWYVQFMPSSGKPAPGDFFTVVVDTRSDAAPRLIPGK